MSDDLSFLGDGWSFPPEFSREEAGVKIVANDDDIKESLFILLSTSPGERMMNPEYGCGIKSMVFQNITESVLTIIKDMISKSILFFEPRITLHSIDVNTEYIEKGLLEINIFYTVRMTNTRSNMVYPYYFMEGTNI